MDNFTLIIDIETGSIINGSSAALNFFVKKDENWKNKNIESFFKDPSFLEDLLHKINTNNHSCEWPITIISCEGKEAIVSIKAQKDVPPYNNTAIITIDNCLSQKIGKLELDHQNSLKILNDIKYALDKAAVVFITNKFGVINYVNDKFCELSQYSKEELIGSTPKILNSGYHPAKFFEELWSDIKNGKTWRGDIKNKKKDGQFYWVDTVIVPISDSSGDIIQYFSIRYDITSKKRKEFLIETSMKEKELMIHEIQYRVKNNLQIISSLINLRKNPENGFEHNQVLSEIQGEVISMSLAFDEIYLSNNYTQIDFANYIGRLCKHLSNNYSPKPIDFKVSGKSFELNLELTINLGIILSQIISIFLKRIQNSENKPIINISFSQENSLFLIKIRTLDSGFSECKNPNNRIEMGIELIQGIVLQIGGQLKMFYEDGAVYEISIKT